MVTVTFTEKEAEAIRWWAIRVLSSTDSRAVVQFFQNDTVLANALMTGLSKFSSPGRRQEESKVHELQEF